MTCSVKLHGVLLHSSFALGLENTLAHLKHQEILEKQSETEVRPTCRFKTSLFVKLC